MPAAADPDGSASAPHPAPTAVALCAGVGGLELSVDASVAAAADTDPAANEVWAARWPRADRIGDWTELGSLDQWNPDLVTAGLPCQPVSTAGLMKGRDDERWLQDDLLRLLGRSAHKPVLWLENVLGILDRRFYGHLIYGLGSLGYVGRWGVVSAAAAGAPHLRRRWFALAVHRDASAPRLAIPRPSQYGGPGTASPRSGTLNDPGGGHLLPTPTATDDRGPHLVPNASRRLLRDIAFMLPDDWGAAEPAMRRWEQIMGRPPPEPTRRGKVVSARFTEWLMGFPEGWVDDLLGNRRALRLLGNAVVPQQSALALGLLTEPARPAATLF